MAQVTAYGFLEVLQVPEGEFLLQTAAGSTLGRQLIVLAHQRGVRTVNLVRRKAQAQDLLDIGAPALCRWQGSKTAVTAVM